MLMMCNAIDYQDFDFTPGTGHTVMGNSPQCIMLLVYSGPCVCITLQYNLNRTKQMKQWVEHL